MAYQTVVVAYPWVGVTQVVVACQTVAEVFHAKACQSELKDIAC